MSTIILFWLLTSSQYLIASAYVETLYGVVGYIWRWAKNWYISSMISVEWIQKRGIHTSSDRWMPSWFGHRKPGDNWPISIRNYITPSFQKPSVDCGGKSSLHLITFVQHLSERIVSLLFFFSDAVAPVENHWYIADSKKQSPKLYLVLWLIPISIYPTCQCDMISICPDMRFWDFT